MKTTPESRATTRFSHPRPRLNRLLEAGALALTLLMAITAPLQVLLAMLAPGGLFVLSALFTLLLAAFVLMQTAVAPEVSVSADGLTLHPVVWRDRHLPWEAVRAVKVYPLLPAEDAETVRRVTVGRLNYAPAAGIMLVIPGLPPQYRIAGFLAGERGAPVVALTNRAHVDYLALVEAVLGHTAPATHDVELLGVAGAAGPHDDEQASTKDRIPHE